MEELSILGAAIKEKRLSLNKRMEEVAKEANITRATLWSIEKGTGSCSAASLFKVMNVLGLSFNVGNQTNRTNRNRATRTNTSMDKKINRFVVMCVEQYALYSHQSSGVVYKLMNDKGIIDDLTNDYEDLHGMSSIYLNEYIDSLMR